jgi:hypothetical protein
MPSSNRSVIVRLIVLVVALGAVVGAMLLMKNRPAGPVGVEASIAAGELWGEPREAADELFGSTPTRVPRDERDPPTTERWLYEVASSPGTYYLVRVQNGTISQAQRADEHGEALRPEDIP